MLIYNVFQRLYNDVKLSLWRHSEDIEWRYWICCRIKSAIDEKIKLYLRDSYDIGTTPLFPMHCHSIKESAVVNFTVDMANTASTPTNS